LFTHLSAGREWRRRYAPYAADTTVRQAEVSNRLAGERVVCGTGTCGAFTHRETGEMRNACGSAACGNIVFKADDQPTQLEDRLERAIMRRFGLAIPVTEAWYQLFKRGDATLMTRLAAEANA
jgi:hypothetical protein